MHRIKSLNLFASFALVCTFAVLAQAQGAFQSVYTDLAESKCRTLEVVEETGASVQRCAGIDGYKLLVLDDDSRQSITVVDPSGKEHPLDYWHTITGGFSSVGNKAEWRVIRKNRKRIPVALIVRVNANEDAENPNRMTSYLAVAKIAAEKICVTHKIRSSAGANESARRAADSAKNAPCLKELTP
jgi:hypothetical protein